jgi:hypothetical protein
MSSQIHMRFDYIVSVSNVTRGLGAAETHLSRSATPHLLHQLQRVTLITTLMASPAATPEPLRLLSLPAELRDHIFVLTFADNSEQDTINILDAGLYVPPVALSYVNRQVRHETLQLYPKATLAFWSSRTFEIRITLGPSSFTRQVDIDTEIEHLKMMSGAGMKMRDLVIHAVHTKDFNALLVPCELELKVKFESNGRALRSVSVKFLKGTQLRGPTIARSEAAMLGHFQEFLRPATRAESFNIG